MTGIGDTSAAGDVGPFTVDGFSRTIGALPATTLVEQWDSHVAKVGGKVFALLAGDGSGISFKVPETSFEILCAIEGIDQAPYFARRQWVRVAPQAPLAAAELDAYIAGSHRMVAAGLTRKARAELALPEAQFGRAARR